jgi:hypothetical protein
MTREYDSCIDPATSHASFNVPVLFATPHWRCHLDNAAAVDRLFRGDQIVAHTTTTVKEAVEQLTRLALTGAVMQGFRLGTGFWGAGNARDAVKRLHRVYRLIDSVIEDAYFEITIAVVVDI